MSCCWKRTGEFSVIALGEKDYEEGSKLVAR